MSVHQKQINAYECTTCGAVYRREGEAHACSRTHEIHAALVSLRASVRFDTPDYLGARAALCSEMLDREPDVLDLIWPPAPADAAPKEER